MKNLFFIIFIIILIYLSGLKRSKNQEVKMFSVEMTDILKGIAICLVILTHLAGYSGSVLFTPLGGIGVAIFLFLSGYGAYKSFYKKGLKNFWKKKIFNVLVPYIIVQICACLLGLINYKTIILFLKDILLLNIKHPNGWYMQCIFIYYLIFWISFYLFGNYGKKVFYTFSIVLAFVFLVNGKEIFFEQILSFPLGVAFGQNKELAKKFISNKNMIVLILFGIVFLGLKQFYFIRSNYLMFYICQLGIKLPLACSIIIFLNVHTKLVPITFFKRIGKNSYLLYLTHFYILELLLQFIAYDFKLITIYIVVLFLFEYVANNIKISKFNFKKIKY